MTFNRYYQEELSFLREMGKEFADAFPAAGQFLADRASDPDVERILEGFAFLTGRIRCKLDDEFPELIQGMMNLLWPHYLRAIPSMSIVEFEPIAGMVKEVQRIGSGTEVNSVPVQGTPCRFRTCFDVDLLPLTVSEAAIEIPSGRLHQLRLQFRATAGADFSKLSFDKIRLYLHGNPGFSLYLWFCRYIKSIIVRHKRPDAPDKHIRLEPSAIEPAGFDESEGLLPYPDTSFEGYRYLQEYFCFPEKFLFIDITGLDCLNTDEIGNFFEIVFELSRPFPSSLRITRDNLRPNCTPVVNIFSMESDPVRVEHNKTEYRIRPAGADPAHYEIYSVDKVMSWTRGSVKERRYEPFYSFKHSVPSSGGERIYYHTSLRPTVTGQGAETYISFVNSEHSPIIPPTEIVAINLTCINRFLGDQLRVGDINVPADTSPEFARFRNIIKVREEIPSPFGRDLYWRLLSHLSLNHLSLSSVQALRGILSLYNFQALYDRHAARANELRLEGIRSIKSDKTTRLFQGMPVRGVATRLELQEDKFAGEGDMYLFASILNEFLALYATINSFTQLTVRGTQEGEVYKWKPRIGKQIII
jgi:type VI secretion system protein ImpG